MKALINLLAIVVTLQCTAYCGRGITASGEYVRDGICAMDKLNGMLVPFGAKVILPNGKVLIVKDRFGAGHNNHLDIWMASEDECWQFGRQWLKCRIEVEK
jgi:3D (Asp-Asp-Asp) domain-containing protein